MAEASRGLLGPSVDRQAHVPGLFHGRKANLHFWRLIGHPERVCAQAGVLAVLGYGHGEQVGWRFPTRVDALLADFHRMEYHR